MGKFQRCLGSRVGLLGVERVEAGSADALQETF